MNPHPLKHPIELSATKTISELKFKPHPTAIDYIAFDTPGPNMQSILLISSLTNTHQTIIEKLHREDFLELDKIAYRMVYPELYDDAGNLLSENQQKETIEKKDSAS